MVEKGLAASFGGSAEQCASTDDRSTKSDLL